MEKRRVPDDRRAPIVADQNGLSLAEALDQARDVGAHLLDRIGLDRSRLVAAAIAAHIGRGHAITGLRKSRNLMTPGIPALGPAVHQHDQRSLSRKSHAQLNAIGLDGHKFRFGLHGRLHGWVAGSSTWQDTSLPVTSREKKYFRLVRLEDAVIARSEGDEAIQSLS